MRSSRLNQWEKYKEFLYPIDSSVKNRRNTRWIIKCLDCLNPREISYCQAWNIAKEKHSGRCQSCAEKNKESRPKQEKKHQRKLDDVLKYRNMFENPAHLPEVQEKMSKAKLGFRNELANAWDGGKTKERILLTSREEYKVLRKQVFERDNYTCLICNKRGDYLQVDHIKEWCNYPELRFEMTNLRTLCINCHKKTDNYGTKARKRSV